MLLLDKYRTSTWTLFDSINLFAWKSPSTFICCHFLLFSFIVCGYRHFGRLNIPWCIQKLQYSLRGQITIQGAIHLCGNSRRPAAAITWNCARQCGLCEARLADYCSGQKLFSVSNVKSLRWNAMSATMIKYNKDAFLIYWRSNSKHSEKCLNLRQDK